MRQRSPRSPIQRIAIISSALLALVGGYYWGNQHRGQVDSRPPLQNLSATLLRHSEALSGFELMNQAAQPFTPIHLQDHWSFLFFDCTYCRSTPKLLSLLARTRNRLAANPTLQASTLMLMIGSDPDRDSPEHLQRLLAGFDTGFMAVTGREEQIAGLANQLGIPNRLRQSKNGAIWLISPEAKPVALFPKGLNATQIAADFQQIVGYHD